MLRLALHWQILIAMVLGAAGGILANLNYGSYQTEKRIAFAGGEIQVHGMASPARLKAGTLWINDSTDQVLIEVDQGTSKADTLTRQRYIVRSTLSQSEINWPQLGPQVEPDKITTTQVQTLKDLQSSEPAVYALFHLHGRSFARKVSDFSKLIGDLFLRMLKMVSIPLIITSLITGITGLGQAERLGKMFGRTIGYYISTSLLAIITGLTLVNVISPGVRNQPAQANAADAKDEQQADGKQAAEQQEVVPQREGKSLWTVLFEQVENMIPPNPFHAAANGQFLSVIAFSILFGVFTVMIGGRTAELIGQLAEASFEVIMRMTMAIIYLAPIGVLFMMMSATAVQGFSVFQALGWYMITVACALAFHAIITLPILLKFVAKTNPWEYAKAMSPALLTGFSSASSNGTLPLTITCAEERAGISNRVSSFVLPLGATINMDGTALYEAVAVLFIAQFTGHDLSFAEQIIVAITALLASIGAAGIPHAGLIMMIIILQAVGLPTETQGIIIAVDRVLDMARTSVNIWSDSCGCAVVSRFERET